MKKMMRLWHKHNANIVLIVLLVVFTFYATFLALKLKRAIVPDEPYRFEVSQHFATTWGIPDDVAVAEYYGEDLHRNPYLGYWIFARIINIQDLIAPSGGERQTLVFLRMANVLFALGTVLYGFFISKELIKHKWWRLLPVFLVTNTLMFVFLSGGVSYDNPTNFFCAASLFYLIRVLNKKSFLSNTLGWVIFILIGSLIKTTVLPLALVMVVVWLIFVLKNRKEITLSGVKDWKTICLFIILVIVLAFIIGLYGVNVIKFQSLTPACRDTFSTEICQATPFAIRQKELGLPEKLSVLEAFKRGYPEPIRYTFDSWIPEMMKRIFGIMAHKNYFPIATSYIQIALLWVLFLGARYSKKPGDIFLSLLGIFSFYTLTLIAINYNTELVYGFDKFVALQGRYIFPVITIAVVLIAIILTKVQHKLTRFVTAGVLIVLFLYSGPIRFLWYYSSVFADWFI